MDLPDHIAGIVHDVKNRLQLLSPDVMFLCENDSSDVRDAGVSINSALDEINHQLVLLLGIYRLEQANLFTQEQCYLSDVLESVVARVKGYDCRVDCAEDITAFCDVRLITAVLGDALHNAVRHCQHQVNLSARIEGKGVMIRIEDDGLGTLDSSADDSLHDFIDDTVDDSIHDFIDDTVDDSPDHVPDRFLADAPAATRNVAVNTGLGLMLASKIAAAHRNQGLSGYATLGSSVTLGGACFELFLP